MAEVLFYHLTQTPLERTLPDLLAKSRARGWNVVVRSGSEDRLEWLDKRLWLGLDTDFLAHGREGGTFDVDQPILLTLGTNIPNDAQILFAVDMADVTGSEAADFTRVCIVFDGNDEAALVHARNQWKSLTEAGLPAKYWSQESGNWQVKAEKNT